MFYFERVSHFVAHDGFELEILLLHLLSAGILGMFPGLPHY